MAVRQADAMTMVTAGFTEEDGYRMAKALLAKTTPDVVIAVNDPVAIGAYRFLRERKIRVPQEIALAGFSDLKGSDILSVPLTTVREQTDMLGRCAVESLLAEIEQSGHIKDVTRLPTELAVRDSA